MNPILLGARCDLCPLRKEGVPVPPTPNKKRLKLIVVGEGPSKTEEAAGTPFVGMSGKLLDKSFREHGVDRDSVWVTNAALCRAETDKEHEVAAACCAPRLLRELAVLDTAVPILALGKTPTISLLGYRKILNGRGFIWAAREIELSAVKTAEREAIKAIGTKKQATKELRAESLRGRRVLAGRTVLPTVHPQFVLRADTWHPIWKIDMRRALRLASGEAIPREEEGPYRVGGLEVLSGLGKVVSCDIETDGIKPLECKMLCVGLSDGEKTAVIWPWKRSYAKRLSRWLASRSQVVFHNGQNFDLLVMREHGVVW